MIADSAARERALDAATSFIVQAPAGSGKTELLIQRYLKLLALVDSPDGVAAITFTRKAAGEMRARVIEALRKAEAGIAPETAHERVTHEIARDALEHSLSLRWNLLQNTAQMRIETIDALCAAITRRMPWLSRFGAMPDILEKANSLYREAARNTLRRVEDGDPALSYLLLHLDNDFAAAERLIMNMLEKRDQWLRHTGANPDFDAVRRLLEESLERLILAELARLREGFDREVAAEIVLLRELDRFPEARMEDIEQWKIVAELLLTGAGEWRKQVNRNLGFPPNHPLKARVEQLLARLRSDDGLLEALQRFRELPGPRFSDSQWQAMQATVSVLTLAAAELQMVFRERGQVDFAELAIRASEALGHVESPTDLALVLGQNIQHILLDEFQDTSYTQFELVEKLTAAWEPGDGRTLFLVGDPMQSIYRFRQADVGLFLKARVEGIGSIQLEPLALSVNFRSRQGIVDWVNETFEGILPAADDPASGAVAFSRSRVREESEETSQDSAACVQMHGFLDGVDEAKRVVELVKTAGGGKVAVLVRARSHLVEIVGALKRAGIPFQAIEIDELGERQVIEDLMALTLGLLHAADRVAWLAILRAPWCGLELSDLHALASGDHRAAIWDLLHREDISLSPDGAARIRNILPVLDQAMAERGRRPLRDWVEGAWFRLGGPACVENDAALENAAAYFDLLEEAAEGADLADFDWFREQVNSLFAQPDARAGDQLQLMTIHKAKGLEFDTVILPGLGAIPRPEEQRLLLWLEQNGALLLAPISEAGQVPDAIYTYLAHVEERKIRRETARLLYVASTRARSRLHLLGTLRLKDDGSIAEPPSQSLLKLLWPAVGRAFENLARAEFAGEGRAVRKIRRVPVEWKAPAPPEAVEWTRRQMESVEIQRVTFEWVSQSARHAGTALHGLMLRIAREGLEAWNENAVRSRRGLYQAILQNLGVPPGEMAEAVERVESALGRMLRDPKGRWILDRHSEGECELPITGLVDGKLYETVIDRTFVDENGVRWIIDYKTGSHEGGGLEKFLDDEQERYREQLERYARLMLQRDPRPIRLALYFPLLGGWREWPAPAAMRKQARLFEL